MTNKKVSFIHKFYMGLTAGIFFIFLTIVLLISNTPLKKYYSDNLIPQGDGWNILIYLMIPIFITGLICFIYFLFSIYFKNGNGMINLKRIISGYDPDSEESKSDTKEELSRFSREHHGVLRDIISALNRHAEHPQTQTNMLERVDSAVCNFQTGYDSVARWMIHCANTLILLGLLGSFLGINLAVKGFNDAVPTQPKPSPKETPPTLDAITIEGKLQAIISPGLNNNRNMRSSDDENKIFDRIKGIFQGLSTAFLCSIWGIVFMVIVATLATLANNLFNLISNEVEDIAKHELSYIYDPGISGFQQVTFNLMTAVQDLLEIKKDVTLLRETVTDFAGEMKTVESNVKAFHTELDKSVKENTKKFGTVTKEFEEKFKGLYEHNTNILTKYNHGVDTFKNLLSTVEQNEKRLDTTLKAIDGKLPDFISLSSEMVRSNREIIPHFESTINLSNLLIEGVKNSLNQIQSLQESLSGLIRSAQSIPDTIKSNENLMVNMMSDKFGDLITRVDIKMNDQSDRFNIVVNEIQKNSNAMIRVKDGILDTQKLIMTEYKEEYTQLFEKISGQVVEKQMEKFNKSIGIVKEIETNISHFEAQLSRLLQSLQKSSPLKQESEKAMAVMET